MMAGEAGVNLNNGSGGGEPSEDSLKPPTAATTTAAAAGAGGGGSADKSYLKRYPYLFVRENDQTDYFCTLCDAYLREVRTNHKALLGELGSSCYTACT